MTRCLGLSVMAVLLALLATCGGSGTTPAPTATVAPTTAATPTTAPTSTPAADTSAGSSIEPSPTAEPVDLVVMAASGGGGVAERYAPRLAEALDREVRNHGHLGALPTEVLSGAESGADVVAEADAILMYFPPEGFEPPGFLPCLDALGDGGNDTVQPPEATTAEDWQAWRDALDQEYEAIWTLRENQPTIIRGYGGWNPWLPVWREAGIESACISGLDALDEVEREAAEAHGAVHVSTLDVFNSPQHDQDPAEQGWIDTDGMHLSDAGKDRLVETLAAAGFEYNEPPD